MLDGSGIVAIDIIMRPVTLIQYSYVIFIVHVDISLISFVIYSFDCYVMYISKTNTNSWPSRNKQ